jgi:uncharacterized protein (TIGR02466 family)
MNIYNLFPIPLAEFSIDRNITSTEKSFILNLKKEKNVYNQTSISKDILNFPELKNIRDYCIKNLEYFFLQVWSPYNPLSLYITQSWVNYTDPGESHHMHAHSNSFVSGVFYIEADYDHDRIYFDRTCYRQFYIPTENNNQWNSNDWWLSVKSGDLLLFPSGLSHYVNPNKTSKTRISISFNTFFKGHLGRSEDMSELILK